MKLSGVLFSASQTLRLKVFGRSVPLSLLTLDENGNPRIDRRILLNQREMTIQLDSSKLFKLNAGTTGVCEHVGLHSFDFAYSQKLDRVLYSPECLVAIAKEAAKDSSPLSVADRMGLVYDGVALAGAGYSQISDVLTLFDVLHNEKECEYTYDRIAAQQPLSRC